MERPSFWNVPKGYKSPTTTDSFTINTPTKSVSFKNVNTNISPTKLVSFQEDVTPGSPAHQSGLRSGDIVHQINYQPANILSHQRASDTIKNSPYSCNLSVERTIPITLLTPPCSPQTQSANYTPVPMYSTQNSLSPTGSSLSAGSLYRPQHLCSTNTAGVIPSFDHVTRDYNSALAQEKRQFYEDRARERASVITQPHRTLPVVSPKPKSVHDYPTLGKKYYIGLNYPIGSYLRYVKDPTWHTTPTRSNIPQAEKLRQVATQYGATPNEKLVNLQYNTPINIYSNQNVAKALNQNKGLNSLKSISYSNNLPVLIDLKSVPIPKNPKDNRILNWINARGPEVEQDITTSPTWQYLQQEDELRRQQRASPAFNRNMYPVQSHSFNTLRTSLLDAPGC